MKLTVLGKYGPYPAPSGGTSSYLVKGGDANLALDFGSGALSRIMNYLDVEKLDGIVLSHLHLDHISDLLPLSYMLKGKEMNLYLPLTDGIEYDMISSLECYNLIPIFHRRDIKIKGLSLDFFQMTHTIESYAVKVSDGSRSLFYSGDTTFNDKILNYAADSDLLLLDCAQPSKSNGAPHMTLSEGALIAKAIGKKVLATHVNPKLPPYAEAKTLGIEVAEEMSVYNV